jgi:ribonuclease P protein component
MLRSSTTLKFAVVINNRAWSYSREQADLSAEQSPARQDARLPPAYADPRRSRHPLRPSPQGPRRAVGLNPSGRPAVLPYANRLRRPAQFRSVMAAGRRARRGCLVVHVLADGDQESARSAPIVGFVVGRSVGNSVARHQVSRRLRAQMRDRLASLPPTSATVVRALPGAAAQDSATLGRDLDAALGRLR